MTRFVRFTCVLIGVAASGCVTVPAREATVAGPNSVFRPATQLGVSATEYRVAPPDKLLIHAAGLKELDAQSMTIRPDGMISINLAGEIAVAGQTPAEIGKLLTAAVAKYYNNVEIRVEVLEYNSKFYEVFGTAVREPGRKAYTGRNTVVSALAQAGFNERSWPQQVRVSRPAKTHDVQPETAVIDMTRVYLEGDTRQNYLLEEGDIVFVPTGPLAAWEEKTRQVFGPLSAGAGTAGSLATPRP